ncbi:uncharacterized protein N7477_008196 [Penicillium maclennaniae]|uniref:uncharacterized protein n=1 Tax=Penicillium maclennaniae TaxID=1343394 RepID=UPI002541807C|nr:uncharacterized protein N7477_008196 [Penicillium maclennaniae]KAJ5665748.1 hypothetical protein N7477_008196 [Penicillium maclennaniae]
MSRTIDLGQCLLYASDSLLQLQFSAVAHFIHPSNRESIELPIDAFQWLDQASIWITEAPELEIRLSLSVHTWLKLASSPLLCSLSDMLCNSKVPHTYVYGRLSLTLMPPQIWSDLGFAIVLKGYGDDQITFGLCRIPTTSNLTKGRALPSVLRNPPDAHVPPGVPTISLAAINIYAEYQYPQGEQNTHKPMHFHIGHMSQPQWLFSSAECYYPTHLKNSEMVAFSSSPHKPGTFSFRDSTLLPDLGMGLPSLQHNSTDNSFGAMLRLIDFGLRKLIVSSGARDRQIRVNDNDSLLSLSDLAPAIFNPRYREVSLNLYHMGDSFISSPYAGSISKSSIDPYHLQVCGIYACK